jgi:hypothetical protein
MLSPGALRRIARDLGFNKEWVERLIVERPEDLERWGAQGHVPPEEDPKNDS